MEDRTARIVGGLIAGLGLVLSGVHLLHGIQEVTEELPAVLYGTLVPLVVSLFILGVGIWIARHRGATVSPWQYVGWCGGGVITGIGISALFIRYQAAEGVTVADSWFVLAMFATYGGAFGLLLGRYDIRRREEHAEQVRKTERLEEFASIVSHDLRNPLNVAQGRLDLARETGDSDHLEDVEGALTRMEMLIQDLLTLAHGRELKTDVTKVDLAETASSCWGHVETADATLRIETDLTIQADRHRLQQLLENLFRNAIEHGGAEVTITVGDLAETPGFYVEDTGPGIPADQRDRIFDAGYTTAQGGTGFGLRIVAEICTDHGWEVSVTEGTDGGARFEISGVERSS